MPFQVSFSHRSTPVGIIESFTAGPDQLVICDPTVFLSAIVIGDLAGHTILWEQIDGTAVTFLTPLNQFDISYTTATFDDKAFRFYIDKGTAFEQFDDVNMFSAPTFPYYGGVPDQNCNINFGTGLHCNQPVVEETYAFPATPITVVECNITTTPLLRWTYPCDQSNTLIQFVVQERSAPGPWTDEAIIPPGDFPTVTHSPLNIGSTYRICAVTLELNSKIATAYSNTIYVDGTFGQTFDSAGAAVTHPLHTAVPKGIAEYVQIPSYTINLITLLTCSQDAPDNFYNSSSGSIDNLSMEAYSVVVLTLKQESPDAPDNFYNQHNGIPTEIVIPTYTVLDLIGGEIGG